MTSDIIVVGAGLAGMAAAHEAVLRGKRVLMLDMEGPQSLGGQAFWSLGGLFMVDTPEQRRMGIKDSRELAMSDWRGSAQFGYHGYNALEGTFLGGCLFSGRAAGRHAG